MVVLKQHPWLDRAFPGKLVQAPKAKGEKKNSVAQARRRTCSWVGLPLQKFFFFFPLLPPPLREIITSPPDKRNITLPFSIHRKKGCVISTVYSLFCILGFLCQSLHRRSSSLSRLGERLGLAA